MKKYGIIVICIVLVFIMSFVLWSRQSGNGKIESGTVSLQQRNQPTMTDQLIIEDIAVGSGNAVKSGDTVVIHYEGTLPTGEVFDSSYKRGQPFATAIGVGRVIKGWDEGVVGMKVGGKRKLTIPPDKAYGAQGVPGAIPPNATLIFTLELLEIKTL